MPRFEGNPILTPIKDHLWESYYVFNPAVTKIGDRIHIFYRAMGEDMVSRIGYATSKDGYHIDERLDSPVFEPFFPVEKRGCEDPRLTQLGDRCVMTYTAFGDIFQIGLTTIELEYLTEKKWAWGERYFPFPNVMNKNAVIFPRMINGQYVMYHRLWPDIHIAHSMDLRNWRISRCVMRPRPAFWDSVRVGAGAPPIELDEGWLMIYHGVDQYRTYRLGAALIDKENPEKVLYRSDEAILEPREPYELDGLVPNVVFSCGAVMHRGQLFLYYGAADMVIGLATYSLDELLV